jgi:hypothetical protein
MPPELTGYLDLLKGIPFVRSASVDKRQHKNGDLSIDALLKVRTPTGIEQLYCEVKSSNMSRELAAQVVGLARQIHPLLVLAPIIGAGIGDFLVENKINFVDLRGNCYLNLGDRYVARIQGHRGEQQPTARALRTPSYQVLFTILAEPSLLSAPVRALASASGVSRQAVVTLQERLSELGHVVKGPRGYVWAATGMRRALDLWLAGYATSVRPTLLAGTYRTQDTDPAMLETRIAPILDESCEWRWGGGAAAHRMTGYFRGEKTVVHVAEAPVALPKKLRAIPDRSGPLAILRSPGPSGFTGTTVDTAHPLLVYTELLADGSERAREAAQLLAERYSIGTAP